MQFMSDNQVEIKNLWTDCGRKDWGHNKNFIVKWVYLYLVDGV